MDILVAYCESWDTPLRTSKHHYISRLAEMGHRILYVEIPANPLSIIRRPKYFLQQKLPSCIAGPKQVAKNIWTISGIFPLPYHRGFHGIFDHLLLNKINQVIFNIRLKKHLLRLGFSDLILLSYYPLHFPILNKLKPQRSVFHMVDEWQGMSGIPKSMSILTQKLLETADATIVTSKVLYDRYEPIAKNIHLLRHGTDVSLFKTVFEYTINQDIRLEAITGLKIGYYGALHKLDFHIISEVAKMRPDWSFIFMGPINGVQGLVINKKLADNVIFWDSCERSKLPNFLAGIDVFWMPFIDNDLTNAMCPIKLYEVLGSGKPIVTTSLSEIKDVAGNNIEYARSSIQHLEALEYCINNDSLNKQKQRIDIVKDYDWDNRITEFEKILFG